jgi:hypothetical protein
MRMGCKLCEIDNALRMSKAAQFCDHGDENVEFICSGEKIV